ncbi:flap endonuclease GEN-like 1 [Diospyros lotus]|uniref:flap endonuclease GEN-like 1 n=1 Tax=Diospyros lotus TaxID=55363 RepID=UPI00224E6DE1|nr:flap endonuclease GEN-like 1 [Diospyros lotus]
MGVGGHFWDLLKPYSRSEGFDFLRNKRVAVDLSIWIVQHETAIRAYARNPNLRLTFFRTVNLFSKFGAFPVFVVDGMASPLKSQARIARFFQLSGIDLSSSSVAEEGVSVERNWKFQKSIQECVELLELLGMPILKAKGEAEALCGKLNSEGHVDACITADSDAFLFGAHCVVKLIRPNSKEPFECYNMSDIEAGLGLKRKHLIAIALLVGNDHDLNGVQGIGLDTALRFVKSFREDEVLIRLSEIGRGDRLQFQGGIRSVSDSLCSSDDSSPKPKSRHCSLCGHPGSKKAHLELACEYCHPLTNEGCMPKPVGFKCDCTSCYLDRRDKELKKIKNWQFKVCQKIAMEENFPNVEIVELYLNNQHDFSADDAGHLAWESPETEMLVDYLAFHQHWEPSYIRQKLLPMLSTIFLREMASNPNGDLLYGQYEFHSIQRLKIRYGHQSFLVKWKKASPAANNTVPTAKSDEVQSDSSKLDESTDSLDEADEPQIFLENDSWFLLTDENMELVEAAFPETVDAFLKEKELKEMKSRTKKSGETPSELATPKGVQRSLTDFYRSSKALCQVKIPDGLAKNRHRGTTDSPDGKRKGSSPKLSKSVRRRLLFE